MPNGIWGANPLFMVQGGQYYYFHNDHLATPWKLTDGNGQTVWSATYAAFGQATISGLSIIENPLRFPGQYFDPETGVHYNWHRYYDPQRGRYVTADPVGFAAGDVNLYRYVGNEPISYFDQYGLKTTGQIPTRDDFDDFYEDHGLDWLPEFARDFIYEVFMDPTAVGSVGGGVGKTGKGAICSIKRNKKLSDSLEKWFQKQYGGLRNIGIKTKRGWRYIDNLLREDQVAKEIKMGRVSLNRRVVEQIKKDIELISRPEYNIEKIEWHFYPGQTGAGPTKPLEKALEDAGIEVIY